MLTYEQMQEALNRAEESRRSSALRAARLMNDVAAACKKAWNAPAESVGFISGKLDNRESMPTLIPDANFRVFNENGIWKSTLGVKVPDSTGRVNLIVTVVLAVQFDKTLPQSVLRVNGIDEDFHFRGGPGAELTLSNIAEVIAGSVVKLAEDYSSGKQFEEKGPIGFNILQTASPISSSSGA